MVMLQLLAVWHSFDLQAVKHHVVLVAGGKCLGLKLSDELSGPSTQHGSCACQQQRCQQQQQQQH
jgi:hypothetical protein